MINLSPEQVTAAMEEMRASLAREIDKNPGIEPLAARFAMMADGCSPVSVLGAAVSLIHGAASAVVEIGAAQVGGAMSAAIPGIQRRAIAQNAVQSLIFAALATIGMQAIDEAGNAPATETPQ